MTICFSKLPKSSFVHAKNKTHINKTWYSNGIIASWLQEIKILACNTVNLWNVNTGKCKILPANLLLHGELSG